MVREASRIREQLLKTDTFATDGRDVRVSTIWAGDTRGFETVICHRAYNEGAWIVVEEYRHRSEAEAGHEKWVHRVTTEPMPPCLIDVSSSPAAKFRTGMTGVEWRRKERTEC
jgi:hypothetical protein